MIDIFNRLQKIFGRPITIVYIGSSHICVTMDWWSKSFEIYPDGRVTEIGRRTASSDWVKGLLQGAKRNDAGELVAHAKAD